MLYKCFKYFSSEILFIPNLKNFISLYCFIIKKIFIFRNRDL